MNYKYNIIYLPLYNIIYIMVIGLENSLGEVGNDKKILNQV